MPHGNGEFWFKSSLFEVEESEQEKTNPGIFGEKLAHWLGEKLRGCGYETDVVAEDFGWCVMCQRDPFWLWVGCASMDSDDPEAREGVPKKEEIVWHCFTVAEVPFWKRLFKKMETKPLLEQLNSDLEQVLSAEPGIQFVEEQ